MATVVIQNGQIISSAAFKLYVGGDTDQLQLAADGKIGIGKSPTIETLDIEGGIAATGQITSPTFFSGFAGSGHRLVEENNEWNLEVDNLTVRKRMRIYELLINQIRATNGSLWVSSAAKADSVSLLDIGKYRIYMPQKQWVPFLEGDIVRAQRFTGQGTFFCEGIVYSISNEIPPDDEDTNRNYYDLFIVKDNLLNDWTLYQRDFEVNGYSSAGNYYKIFSDALFQFTDILFKPEENYIQFRVDKKFDEAPTFKPRMDFIFKESYTTPIYVSFWAMATDIQGNGDDQLTVSFLDSSASTKSTQYVTLGTSFQHYTVYYANSSSFDMQRVAFRGGDDPGTLVLPGELNKETVTIKGLTVSSSISTQVPVADIDFVRIGNVYNTDRQGAVYLTSDDSGAPFIDIIDGVSRSDYFNSPNKSHSRFGNLEGITDPLYGSLSGYGMFTDNIYAMGNINVAGNLSAGDAAGVGNTFFAGKIKNNLVKNNSKYGESYGIPSNLTYTVVQQPTPFGGTDDVAQCVLGAPNPPSTPWVRIGFQNQFGVMKPDVWYTVSFWIRKTDSTEVSCGFDAELGYNDNYKRPLDEFGSMTVYYQSVHPFEVTEEWKRVSYSGRWPSTNGVPTTNATFYCYFSHIGGTVYITGIQYEEGVQNPGLYQPSDGNLYSGSDNYGMWAIAGGFGGTMQNPTIGLSSEGLVIRKDTATAATWGNSNTISIGYQGSVWGIIGKDGSNNVFELGSTNQIAGWTFTNSQLAGVSNRVLIGNNLQEGYARLIIGALDADFTQKIVAIYGGNAATNGLVKMYYTDSTHWGIQGKNTSDVEVFHLGYTNQIAGWTFTNTKISKNSIELDSANSRVRTFNPSATGYYVDLYYTHQGEWGIRGYYNSNRVFHLGSTNEIAGWTFSETALYGTYNDGSDIYTGLLRPTGASSSIAFFAGASNAAGTGAKAYINSDGTAVFADGTITFEANGDITSQDYLLERTRLFGAGGSDVTYAVDTSLSADLYCNNLTINAGKKLTTNNYRIFVKDTLYLNGKIINNGNAGGNGAAGTVNSVNGVYVNGGSGGSGGAAPGSSTATLARGTAGVAGGAGGRSSSEGVNNGSGGGGGGSGSTGGIVFIAARNIVVGVNGKIEAIGGAGGNGGEGGGL